MWRHGVGDDGDETRRRRRPWDELPDHIVYSIAIRLTSSLRDLTAFRGACSAWRSFLSRDSSAILDEFLKRRKQPVKDLEVVPSSSSSSWFVRDRPDNDTDIVLNPCLEKGTFILQKRNATRDNQGIKFNPAKSSFHFAYRVGRISLGCLMVFVSDSLIQRYPIATAAPLCSLIQRYRRIATAAPFCRVVKEFPEGIIPHQPGRDMLSSVIVSVVASKDRLYVAGCRGRVVEVKMIMNDDAGGGGDSYSFFRREIWLEESGGAYPVLGFSEDGKLLMFREDEKKVYQFDSSTDKWEEMMPQGITFTGCRRMLQVT